MSTGRHFGAPAAGYNPTSRSSLLTNYRVFSHRASRVDSGTAADGTSSALRQHQQLQQQAAASFRRTASTAASAAAVAAAARRKVSASYGSLEEQEAALLAAASEGREFALLVLQALAPHLLQLRADYHCCCYIANHPHQQAQMRAALAETVAVVTHAGRRGDWRGGTATAGSAQRRQRSEQLAGMRGAVAAMVHAAINPAAELDSDGFVDFVEHYIRHRFCAPMVETPASVATGRMLLAAVAPTSAAAAAAVASGSSSAQQFAGTAAVSDDDDGVEGGGGNDDTYGGASFVQRLSQSSSPTSSPALSPKAGAAATRANSGGFFSTRLSPKSPLTVAGSGSGVPLKCGDPVLFAVVAAALPPLGSDLSRLAARAAAATFDDAETPTAMTSAASAAAASALSPGSAATDIAPSFGAAARGDAFTALLASEAGVQRLRSELACMFAAIDIEDTNGVCYAELSDYMASAVSASTIAMANGGGGENSKTCGGGGGGGNFMQATVPPPGSGVAVVTAGKYYWWRPPFERCPAVDAAAIGAGATSESSSALPPILSLRQLGAPYQHRLMLHTARTVVRGAQLFEYSVVELYDPSALTAAARRASTANRGGGGGGGSTLHGAGSGKHGGGGAAAQPLGLPLFAGIELGLVASSLEFLPHRDAIVYSAPDMRLRLIRGVRPDATSGASPLTKQRRNFNSNVSATSGGGNSRGSNNTTVVGLPEPSVGVAAGDVFSLLRWSTYWDRLIAASNHGSVSIFREHVPARSSIAMSLARSSIGAGGAMGFSSTSMASSLDHDSDAFVHVASYRNLHESAVTDLLALPLDGALVTSSLDPKLIVQDGESGAVVATLGGHNAGIRAISHSEDYHCIASVGYDPAVHLHVLHQSLRQRPMLLTCSEAPHAAPTVGVHCVPNTPVVVSVDQTGLVHLWDVRTLRSARTVKFDLKRLPGLAPDKMINAMIAVNLNAPRRRAAGRAMSAGDENGDDDDDVADPDEELVRAMPMIFCVSRRYVHAVAPPSAGNASSSSSGRGGGGGGVNRGGSTGVRGARSPTSDALALTAEDDGGDAIVGLAFSPSTTALLTSTQLGSLQSWEARTGRLGTCFANAESATSIEFASQFPNGFGDIACITSDAQGRKIIAGHRGGCVTVRAVVSGQLLRALRLADAAAHVDVVDIQATPASGGLCVACDSTGTAWCFADRDEDGGGNCGGAGSCTQLGPAGGVGYRRVVFSTFLPAAPHLLITVSTSGYTGAGATEQWAPPRATVWVPVGTTPGTHSACDLAPSRAADFLTIRQRQRRASSVAVRGDEDEIEPTCGTFVTVSVVSDNAGDESAAADGDAATMTMMQYFFSFDSAGGVSACRVYPERPAGGGPAMALAGRWRWRGGSASSPVMTCAGADSILYASDLYGALVVCRVSVDPGSLRDAAKVAASAPTAPGSPVASPRSPFHSPRGSSGNPRLLRDEQMLVAPDVVPLVALGAAARGELARAVALQPVPALGLLYVAFQPGRRGIAALAADLSTAPPTHLTLELGGAVGRPPAADAGRWERLLARTEADEECAAGDFISKELLPYERARQLRLLQLKANSSGGFFGSGGGGRREDDGDGEPHRPGARSRQRQPKNNEEIADGDAVGGFSLVPAIALTAARELHGGANEGDGDDDGDANDTEQPREATENATVSTAADASRAAASSGAPRSTVTFLTASGFGDAPFTAFGDDSITTAASSSTDGRRSNAPQIVRLADVRRSRRSFQQHALPVASGGGAAASESGGAVAPPPAARFLTDTSLSVVTESCLNFVLQQQQQSTVSHSGATTATTPPPAGPELLALRRQAAARRAAATPEPLARQRGGDGGVDLLSHHRTSPPLLLQPPRRACTPSATTTAMMRDSRVTVAVLTEAGWRGGARDARAFASSTPVAPPGDGGDAQVAALPSLPVHLRPLSRQALPPAERRLFPMSAAITPNVSRIK